MDGARIMSCALVWVLMIDDMLALSTIGQRMFFTSCTWASTINDYTPYVMADVKLIQMNKDNINTDFGA